jgi:hypothetical protein
MLLSWLRVPILVCLVGAVVALNTFLYNNQHQFESWRFMTQDAFRIATMFHSIDYPQTFPHDWLFRNSEYFRFYTPSFFVLMRLSADGSDAIKPFVPINAITLLLYVPCATLFFWVIARRWVIALIMAVISTHGFHHNQEFWQLNDLYSTLPRSVAMPLIVLTFAIIFGTRQLHPRYSVWMYGLCGICVGLVATLHPSSGIACALVVGLLALLWRIRYKTPSVLAMIVFGIMATVSSVPMLFTVVSNSSFSSETQPRDLSQIGRVMGWLFYYLRDIYFLVFLALAIMVLAWFFSKPNNRWQLLFCLIQVPLSALIIRDSTQLFLAIPLLVGLPLWLGYCYLHKKLDANAMIFEWLGCILLMCQVLPFFIFLILPYQASAYIWATEVARAVRLLSLPFFALLAVVIGEQKDGQKFGAGWLWLGLAYLAVAFQWVLLIPLGALWAIQQLTHWTRHAWFGLIWHSMWVGLATLIVMRSIFLLHFAYCLQVAVITACVAFVVDIMQRHVPRLFLLAPFVVFITPLICLFFTIFAHQNPTNMPKIFAEQVLFSLALALGVGVVAVWIIRQQRLSSREVLLGFVIFLSLQTLLGAFYRRYDFVQPSLLPRIEAAQWAKANTAQDSLFFIVNQNSEFAGNAIEFRIFSLRSISHNLDEANLYRYAKPEDTPIFAKRHAEQIASYQNAESLIAMARQYNADYILIDLYFLGYTLDLPIVFASNNIIIYDLSTQSELP